MKVIIESDKDAKGREFFKFDLFDGPKEKDHAKGYCRDLGSTFAKIEEWRRQISADYEQSTNHQDEPDTREII